MSELDELAAAAQGAGRRVWRKRPPAAAGPASRAWVWIWVGCGILGLIVIGQAMRQQESGPLLGVEAEDLVREYMANQVGADSRWRGRWVAVEGEVNAVGRDIASRAYVVLEGPAGTWRGVQCTFGGSEEGPVARLSRGQRVRIVGRVDGSFWHVQMGDCRLR